MSLVKREYFISINAIILSFIIIVPMITIFLLLFYCLFLSDITIEIKLKIGFFILFLLLILILLESIPRLISYVKLLINKKPALILTDENLIDNINSQTFNWKEINKISIGSMNVVRSKINFIAISLNNPKKHIDNIKNPYKKVIAKINNKYFQGAFSIQPNLLNCDNKELFEVLQEYIN
jgi:hypothetical protein